jgi:HEAT repeats
MTENENINRKCINTICNLSMEAVQAVISHPRRCITAMMAVIALCLTPQLGFGQMRRGLPSPGPGIGHYGCFGYCPVPPRPAVPHYGCFGYCPAPRPYPHDGAYRPYYWRAAGNPYWSNSYYPYSSNYYYPYSSNYSDGGVVPANPSQANPLFGSVDKESSRTEEPRYRGLSVSDWIATLKNPYPGIRANAAAALGHLGPQAKNATPALMEALQDEEAEVRLQAALALAAIGKTAVQPLTKALQDDNRLKRMGAALALVRMDRKAEAAAPVLTEALEDRDISVRCHAAQALWRVTGNAQLAVPGLVEALKHHQSTVRDSAITTLNWIGPDAQMAAPALRELLKDADPHLRERLAEALRSIEAKAAKHEGVR